MDFSRKKQSAVVLIAIILTAGYIALPFITRYVDFRQTIIRDYDLVDSFSSLKFDNPIAVYPHPSSNHYLYVLEANGNIELITLTSNKLPEQSQFLDLTKNVIKPRILGFTFDPAFTTNQYFYLEYVLEEPLRIRISRFQILPLIMAVNITSELIISEFQYEKEDNMGSQITFGNDNMLYIALGDGGTGALAQNLTNYYGKILRIDVANANNNSRYSIPSDNPFIGNSSILPEIYAYGFQNPSNLYYDKTTQNMFVVDKHGNNYEEINTVHAKQNYGWNIFEVNECVDENILCGNTTNTTPIWYYEHKLGDTVVGGIVYHGSGFKALKNKYIYGDYSSGRIWWIGKNATGGWENELLVKKPIHISGFGTNLDGELYICGNNKIYTIVKVTD